MTKPTSTISCSHCSLSGLCLPLGLSITELNKLDKIVKKQSVIEAKQAIYLEKDRFQGLYTVRSGSFKEVTYDLDGKERISAFYLPGEIFGFDAIHEEQYSSSVYALEASSVCLVPFADLLQLTTQIPMLLRQVFNLMSERIKPQLCISAANSAEERVAQFLLNLSSRFKKRGYSASEFNLSMSRQDMGNFLGIALETVSRSLTQLQTLGAIEINRRAVKIVDFDALQKLAKQTFRSA